MQSRRKIWIILMAGLLILLLAGSVTLLVWGFLQLKEVEKNLQAASDTLTSLYSQNPFPSPANLKIERGNIKEVKEELHGLQTAMGAGQVEPTKQSPAKCITQFWETRNALLARAGNTVKIDKAFNFGFGRHMPGDLPSIQDVPRITQQLKIVEELCQILYASKISGLSGLARQEFESDPGAASATPGKPGSALVPARGDGEMGLKNIMDPSAGLIPSGKLYGFWHFSMQFTARENAFMGVLNRMARSPLFISVTRLEIKGDEKVFDRKEAEALAARANEAPEGAEGKDAVKSRDARVICGRDALVNVKMELNVYQFDKPKPKPEESK